MFQYSCPQRPRYILAYISFCRDGGVRGVKTSEWHIIRDSMSRLIYHILKTPNTMKEGKGQTEDKYIYIYILRSYICFNFTLIYWCPDNFPHMDQNYNILDTFRLLWRLPCRHFYSYLQALQCGVMNEHVPMINMGSPEEVVMDNDYFLRARLMKWSISRPPFQRFHLNK